MRGVKGLTEQKVNHWVYGSSQVAVVEVWTPFIPITNLWLLACEFNFQHPGGVEVLLDKAGGYARLSWQFPGLCIHYCTFLADVHVRLLVWSALVYVFFMDWHWRSFVSIQHQQVDSNTHLALKCWKRKSTEWKNNIVIVFPIWLWSSINWMVSRLWKAHNVACLFLAER